MASTEIATDVITAAVPLGGLVLVFLGAISVSFESFQKQEQSAVRSKYQERAWLAFVGFVLSLISAFLALLGKWIQSDCAVTASAVILFIDFAWVAFVGLSAVRAIK